MFCFGRLNKSQKCNACCVFVCVQIPCNHEKEYREENLDFVDKSGRCCPIVVFICACLKNYNCLLFIEKDTGVVDKHVDQAGT